jgi:hypothetical protein
MCAMNALLASSVKLVPRSLQANAALVTIVGLVLSAQLRLRALPAGIATCLAGCTRKRAQYALQAPFAARVRQLARLAHKGTTV